MGYYDDPDVQQRLSEEWRASNGSGKVNRRMAGIHRSAYYFYQKGTDIPATSAYSGPLDIERAVSYPEPSQEDLRRYHREQLDAQHKIWPDYEQKANARKKLRKEVMQALEKQRTARERADRLHSKIAKRIHEEHPDMPLYWSEIKYLDIE